MKRTPSENEVLREENRDILFSKNVQCSEDRGHQLLKTLLYYSQNRHLLTKPIEQLRLSSLLLEPGILLEQLTLNPQFTITLGEFIHRGYIDFSQKSEDVSSSLFFLR